MRANISLRNPFLLVKDHRMHSIWLLRIPHPGLAPDHNSGPYLGPEKYTDSLGDWRYAAFSFDMAELSPRLSMYLALHLQCCIVDSDCSRPLAAPLCMSAPERAQSTGSHATSGASCLFRH